MAQVHEDAICEWLRAMAEDGLILEGLNDRVATREYNAELFDCERVRLDTFEARRAIIRSKTDLADATFDCTMPIKRWEENATNGKFWANYWPKWYQRWDAEERELDNKLPPMPSAEDMVKKLQEQQQQQSTESQ